LIKLNSAEITGKFLEISVQPNRPYLGLDFLGNQRIAPPGFLLIPSRTVRLRFTHRHGQIAALRKRICEAHFDNFVVRESHRFHHFWRQKVAIYFDQIARIVRDLSAVMSNGEFMR
jgi:hypothetical protein